MLFTDFKSEKIETSEVSINISHGGNGRPLLLLHGYPQTHIMWHKIAPQLSADFHVICADLRGYGDSSKPKSADDHYTYSKRAMASDMTQVMNTLGYKKFFVAGHDRGGRVVHRMCLDFPHNIEKACVMDIAPTHTMFNSTDKNFATGYYHWFFLIQPGGLPEKLIGSDPKYYLEEKLKRWSGKNKSFNKKAVREYVRCFCSPDAIAASCEDYRAAATIDLIHDEADFENKIKCPLLVLWGNEGFIHRTYDVLKTWKDKADNVQGKALSSGHFLAEENPEETLKELTVFFND